MQAGVSPASGGPCWCLDTGQLFLLGLHCPLCFIKPLEISAEDPGSGGSSDPLHTGLLKGERGLGPNCTHIGWWVQETRAVGLLQFRIQCSCSLRRVVKCQKIMGIIFKT